MTKESKKSQAAYKSIGEVAKEVGLVDEKTGALQTHTIRYWESQFKQLKPKIRAGKRRYYSPKDLEIIIYIKHLLKEKGLTINGAKKLLNKNEVESIDELVNMGVYKTSSKSNKTIKEKIKKISKIVKELRKLKNG